MMSGNPVEDPNPAPVTVDPNAPASVVDDDDDGVVEAVNVGGQKMVPIGEMLKYRKEAKSVRRDMEALKPQIEQAQRTAQQLAEVQPLLDQVRSMPAAAREALAAGRMPSPEGTRHNTEDVEAKELAEDLGLIATDGQLDISRARKRLDKDTVRFQRMMEQAVAPLRTSTATQAAAGLTMQAKAIRDADGVPLASEASIDEAYKMLPPELAAQPNVAMVAIGTAMLIDRMKGRKVTAPIEHTAMHFSEPSAGRRGGSGITAEERELAKKVGLSDADLTATNNLLRSSTGRGIKME